MYNSQARICRWN